MKRLFLEPDELGLWYRKHGAHEEWQDLGLGILVTIAQEAGFAFDTLSLKAVPSWGVWRSIAKQYDLICMNVRSWRFKWAVKAARIAKAVNPAVQIWGGGMHATVALNEMLNTRVFDVIWPGEGDQGFLYLLSGQKKGLDYPLLAGRVPLDDLPFIDRELMPKGPLSWPLEGPAGWAEGATATMITGRGCPYRCAFCASERLHFGPPRRRSVDNVLEELNYIDKKWGPIGSVVFHDSLFFMNRLWLEEFVEKYSSKTKKWPFWAAARDDLICKWPDLFKAMVRQANWKAISVGFESGSDRVLKILNKGSTVKQCNEAINIINDTGDIMEAMGKERPLVYGNFMVAIPGEEPEDAKATVALSQTIKGAICTLNIYSPYPGTVLGDKIRAEGNAIGDCGDFDSIKPKIKGIDYEFYSKLLGREIK